MPALFLLFQLPDNLPLPQWLRWLVTVLALAIAAATLWRSRTNRLFREERDVYRDKAERLEKETQALRVELAELRAETANLRSRTDITIFMQQLNEAVSNNQSEHKAIVQTLSDLNRGMTELTRALMKLNAKNEQ